MELYWPQYKSRPKRLSEYLIDLREMQEVLYPLGKIIIFLINLTLSEVYPFVDGKSYLQSVESFWQRISLSSLKFKVNISTYIFFIHLKIFMLNISSKTLYFICSM